MHSHSAAFPHCASISPARVGLSPTFSIVTSLPGTTSAATAGKAAEEGSPGCAGVNPVLANRTNGVDPTDPALAGGDAFDLADVGLARARYVRIRDSGVNPYEGTTGGFDLDALAVVNGEPP